VGFASGLHSDEAKRPRGSARGGGGGAGKSDALSVGQVGGQMDAYTDGNTPRSSLAVTRTRRELEAKDSIAKIDRHTYARRLLLQTGDTLSANPSSAIRNFSPPVESAWCSSGLLNSPSSRGANEGAAEGAVATTGVGSDASSDGGGGGACPSLPPTPARERAGAAVTVGAGVIEWPPCVLGACW
jgi:hypothetical protein